jgi:glycosyltransferase involved in cell wall biosynthesis
VNSTQARPSVTVVIPVWDSPYVDWLPHAVEAVCTQDPGVRILVVDNASTVAVPRLEGTDVVRTSQRLSAGEARNAGIRHVDTEFVMFLDADDELLEGALERARREISSDPGLAAFAMSLLEPSTRRRHRYPHRFAFALVRFPRAFALANTVWSLYSTQGCAIFRTAWVRECGGYADLSGPEDWILGVSQAFRGRIRIDRRPGLIYQLHRGSLAHAQSGRYMLLAARRVRERLRNDPAVPGWARALTPMIGVMQAFAIFVLRPIYRATRAAVSGRQ